MKNGFWVRGVAVAVLTFVPAVIRAGDPAPATQPASDAKSTLKIDAEAKTLIEQVDSAYAKLKALDLSGSVSADLQVEGSEPEKHIIEFSSSFSAPNRFRHEAKGDVLLGSTGLKLYAYQIEKNAYTLADAPKERVASSDLPHDLAELLGMQNPSLMLALSKSPSRELLEDVKEAIRAPDVRVREVSCPALKLISNDGTVSTLAFDPDSHLLRLATTDLTAPLKKRRPDLSTAVVATAYTSIRPDGPAKDELFAWSPPPGATDATAAASAHPLDAVAADALVGKPAPIFKLKTLDGKTVSLAQLKGHVIVLDFWATWCGPCRASLPHLDKLYKAEKDNGVEIFAIDQQESEADVLQFVKQTGLSVPVLMDTEGRVGEQYGVEGIPQTVVIGKNGKVSKVFVGFGPELPDQLKKAVDAVRNQ